MLSTLTGGYLNAQIVLLALLGPYLDRAHEAFVGHEQLSTRDWHDLVVQGRFVSKGMIDIVFGKYRFKAWVSNINVNRLCPK